MQCLVHQTVWVMHGSLQHAYTAYDLKIRDIFKHTKLLQATILSSSLATSSVAQPAVVLANPAPAPYAPAGKISGDQHQAVCRVYSAAAFTHAITHAGWL